MNMNLFATDAIVRALGWTLVHSLWQGALAALALLLVLTRLKKARHRYWASYGAMLMVFASGLATFAWTYQPQTRGSVSEVFSENRPPLGPYFVSEALPAEPVFWQAITQWLESNHPFVVAVWLLGFGFFLLRLAVGLWQVGYLRESGIPLSGIWEEKMAVLGTQLGISRPVRLLESALVHAPIAIGWLKPAVLLPIGLVNRLSPAEVEAVLAHELAHIARRDWLFNLVQAFIETLFYYHPAVWWMSQIIRHERENCCDDAALAATGDRFAFAKALVQVQEMAKPAPALALSMNGKSRPLLLERVRRILNQPQQKSQVMEKFTATLILLALLTLVGIRANHTPSLSSAFAQISTFPATFFNGLVAESPVANDTVPKPQSVRKIVREDDNQRVEAEFQDGRLTRLNIDGKEIPATEFDQHRALTHELQREAPMPPAPPMPPGVFFYPPAPDIKGWVPAPPVPPAPLAPPRVSAGKDEAGNTIIMLERNGHPTEIKVVDGQVLVNGTPLKDGESLDLPNNSNGFFYWNGDDGDSFHFAPGAGFSLRGLEGLKGLSGLEELRYLENLDDFPHFKISDEDRALLLEELAQSRAELERARASLRESMKEQKRQQMEEMRTMRKEWQQQQEGWKKEQKEWEKAQKEWAKDMEKLAREEKQEAKALAAHSKQLGQELKAELLRDGLISDPANFQLQLSNTELRVNGKKQSDALHRKYLEFYRAKTGRDFGKNGSFHWNESN
ncbi:MAG: M48 family metalloprotease [Saprospiraceae bacterium]|nr:M48 family metalloprotease [Saprospiraceae bacterium]